MSVSATASRCKGAELFIRPDAAYLLFDEPQRGITPDSSQPGTMAMSWSDRASSPNNRTFPDSVQATAAEEEAYKHGPFYRNPGKTGDKQFTTLRSTLKIQAAITYRTGRFPTSISSQAPFHKEAKERDSPEHAPPANDDKQPRETSLKPEPNIIAILVAAIGIIPPASSIVRKKGAGNEEMPSDKKPPRLLSRGVSIQTDFGLKSKILKIQPSKSRRIPYDQSKRPAPYCISTISEL